MAGSVLFRLSSYLKLNSIINTNIQLKGKHEYNLTIWVSLWKLCSPLFNVLPGAGRKNGKVNLPGGPANTSELLAQSPAKSSLERFPVGHQWVRRQMY